MREREARAAEVPRPSDEREKPEYAEDLAVEASLRLRLRNYFTPDGRWTGCRGKRPT
jgi:hypothetical protein